MPGGGLEPYYGMASRQRIPLYLNLALVPALLLATPLPLRRRLRLLAYAVPLIFVCHVAVEIGLVRVHYCLDVRPAHFLCAWIREHLLIAGQLLAVLQWAALTWSWEPTKRLPLPAKLFWFLAERTWQRR